MAKRSKKNRASSNKARSEAPVAALASPVPAPAPAFSSSRDWFWTALLLVAVVLTYLPVYRAGFIWDDESHLTANPVIVGPLGLLDIWTTKAAQICPLVLTTFWLEHALWGLAPLPYHLVNVILHGINAILLWHLLRHLDIPGAWVGATLWALHPVQVESAAWITELKNTQSCFFYLLSILFFVRWLKTGPPKMRSIRDSDYALTIVFAALAMASKSSTVILPLVLCLSALWVEGRWHWRNLAYVALTLPLSIAACALSLWTQGPNPAISGDPLLKHSLPEHLVAAGNAVWFYLGKLVWPHHLTTIYPLDKFDTAQPLSYLPLLAVIILFAVLWLNRHSWSRPWFFSFTYFLVAMLPELQLADSYVADHYQYLSSMGPLALIGAGVFEARNFILPQKPHLQRLLVAGLLLILAISSWQRTWAYQNQEILWSDSISKNPNSWAAYNGLGVVYDLEKRPDDAMAQFRKAVELSPQSLNAHDNLGMVLNEKGRYDEAIAEYDKALAINPDDPQTHNNYGVTLSQKDRVDDAIIHYQKSLSIDPYSAATYYNLANALVKKGRLDDAILCFQKALQIDSSLTQAHFHLGSAYAQKGQLDDSIAEYELAVKADPSNAEFYFNLGVALTQKGAWGEAIAQYQRALEIDPKYLKAHNNLGNILFKQRKFDEAIAQFEIALKIDPNEADLHSNLGAAYAQNGRLNDAIAEFKEAIRLKPDYTDAQKNLARAQASLNQKGSQK